LKYRLIFKHPDVLQEVASIDFVAAGEDAAIAHFKNIAACLHGELWQGETFLRAIAPEPAHPGR